MKISQYNSQKIKVLSFIAIMMVLYIHAIYKESFDYPLANSIQIFFSITGISFIANPLFYCISGFLFFTGVSNIKDCYPKLKKRVRTLIIPYIIWNIIFVMWYVILAIIPGISQFVNNNMVGEIFCDDILSIPHKLFVVPAGFQLWFVRDLIIYVFFSPIIYLLLKKFGVIIPILFFIVGSIGLVYLPSEIKLWGLFFFILGGWIALHSSLDIIQREISIPIASILGCIYLLNAFLRSFQLFPYSGCDILIELCGLIAMWRLYDVIVKTGTGKLTILLATLGNYAFFIYLFHEPTFNIIKKLGTKILPMQEHYLIGLYLINPFIMAALSIIVAKYLKKILPKTYGVLVGGR